MTRKQFFFAAVAGFIFVAAARAENWPQWRGPLFNGSTTESGLPETWSKTKNVAWVAPMPGMSAATPAVWGDSVFVTSADAGGQLWLICVNRPDGIVRWQKLLGLGDMAKGNNTMVSPSPVTDGSIVIAMFGTGDLAALDFTGNILWKRNLWKESGKFAIMWLYGSSPLLLDGRLYVQVLQNKLPTYEHAKDDKPVRESFLLCIDPKTGKDIWRHIRPTDAQEESQESYATPIPNRAKNADEILLVGGDYVTAHNPETGEEIWRCAGLNVTHNHWRRIVPSAVTCDDIVIACGPRRDPIFAIRDGGKGLVTDTHTAWRNPVLTADVCTPLVYQGKVFALDGDKKKIACVDPKTGTIKWAGDLPVDAVTRASPTAADGKIFCISENGTVVVLSAGDEFKILSTVNMAGESPCRASIAISDSQLFIRTAKNLYCIGKK